MHAALQRSGYLLESRLAALLRTSDFRVETNAAYPDPVTGKSRELDLHANYMRGWQIGPDEDDMLWTELIIECVHPPQPIAFISSPQQSGLLSAIRPVDCARIAGVPLHTDASMQEASWSWLPSVGGFADKHHYGKGVLSTQFCSFEPKRGSKEWVARHRDEDHEAFTKLCDALDFYIADFYRSMYEPPNVRELKLCMMYPVMVVEGDLYEVRASREPLRLRRVEHVRYHRTRMAGDHGRSYVIDVVTERYFPRFISMIGRELDSAATAIVERYDEVRVVLERWIANHKKRTAEQRARRAAV